MAGNNSNDAVSVYLRDAERAKIASAERLLCFIGLSSLPVYVQCLHGGVKRFDDTANTMGLHTSWEKTKLQNTGYGPPPQSVSINGHPVEVTD